MVNKQITNINLGGVDYEIIDTYAQSHISNESVHVTISEKEKWNATLKGAQGDRGLQGVSGDRGVQGIPGSQGVVGLMGTQGAGGDKGKQGATGANGDQGKQGGQGSTGVVGLQGAKGNTGATGDKGNQGGAGTVGDKGKQGATGSTGDKGKQGSVGSAGDKGTQGDRGYQGVQGKQGPQGVFGPTSTTLTLTPTTITDIYNKAPIKAVCSFNGNNMYAPIIVIDKVNNTYRWGLNVNPIDNQLIITLHNTDSNTTKDIIDISPDSIDIYNNVYINGYAVKTTKSTFGTITSSTVSMNVTYSYLFYTNITVNTSITFTGSNGAGECHIIIGNTSGATRTITLANGVKCDGISSISLANNKYAEINVIYNGTTYYVRTIV